MTIGYIISHIFCNIFSHKLYVFSLHNPTHFCSFMYVFSLTIFYLKIGCCFSYFWKIKKQNSGYVICLFFCLYLWLICIKNKWSLFCYFVLFFVWKFILKNSINIIWKNSFFICYFIVKFLRILFDFFIIIFCKVSHILYCLFL